METLFLSGCAILLLCCVFSLVTIKKSGRNNRRIGFFILLSGLICITISSVLCFLNDTDCGRTFYSITEGLSFGFHLDKLSSLFTGLIGIVGFCTVIYTISYIEHGATGKRRQIFAALLPLFILAMIMVVVSDNMFGFLFSWEIMSISSFFLVMHEREKAETQKAGIFYFVMTQFSTLFLFIAFLVIYKYSGTFDIKNAAVLPDAAKGLAFAALFIGFGTKAGLIPFHKWLPYAHSAAPSNISALMSGVMLKVAIYGLCRFTFDVLQPDLWWGFILLAFGTISAVLGVIYALKEHDFKTLLAYHSIENIGIIVLGLGMYIIFNYYGLEIQANLSLVGALFHTFNHAVFKSLLFMTAGSVVQATGTRNIEEMGGLAKTMPFTAVLFLIGACAISALPPLNGFASEVMIFQAYLGSFELNNAVVEIAMVVGLAAFALMSALAAACFVKAFGIVFLAKPRSREAGRATEVSRNMLGGPAVLAFICIVLGVFSYQIIQGIGFDIPIPNLLPVSILLLLITLILIGFLKLARVPVRIEETWACGIRKQTEAMEYTATGFSEPIVTIFRLIFRTRKTNDKEYFDEAKSITKSTKAHISTLQFFEERIYLPFARFVMRIASFISEKHNKDLETFIVYAFVAIVLVLITAGVWL
ncbi:MAG: proton-conducting transporter membrane subunit [Dehalococcoidales bacterium]